MKIGFLVNDVDTEVPAAATTVIARAAAVMGHEVYMIGVDGLGYRTGGGVTAQARPARVPRSASQEQFLAAVQGKDAERVTLECGDLDVLYLRYNPSDDPQNRPWEPDAGIAFGQLAVQQNVLVLSHPYTLPYTLSKVYLEHFPETVRPRTVITRDYAEVQRFHREQKDGIVLKPLMGFGGKDVYLVRDDASNLRQIVESIGRNSFVMAQEYIAEAARGDTRLFLFNGRPLVVDGKYAAVRRVNATEDFRSNMTAGARPKKARVTQTMLRIAEMLRPRLLADGIFDAGIDIVGDKVLEVNAISSGGLNAASRLEGVDFGREVVRLIERKVEYRRVYGPGLRNRQLATMD